MVVGLEDDYTDEEREQMTKVAETQDNLKRDLYKRQMEEEALK